VGKYRYTVATPTPARAATAGTEIDAGCDSATRSATARTMRVRVARLWASRSVSPSGVGMR
jgi:hypothetical protein